MSEKPESPQRFTQIGNWRYLIKDEQEWLSRPAPWGLGCLPEPSRNRKQRLFEHHFYSQLSGWIQCDFCRSIIREFFGEDGVHLPDIIPEDPAVFRAWYGAVHPSTECDGWSSLKAVNQYKRGILTYLELRNALISQHDDMTTSRTREENTQRYWELRQELERVLATELVGPNPFRPVAFDPTWRTSKAVALARQMYETRDFTTLPILADALQDVGCDAGAVLDHCHDPRPHVRGCWVVDTVLGNE